MASLARQLFVTAGNRVTVADGAAAQQQPPRDLGRVPVTGCDDFGADQAAGKDRVRAGVGTSEAADAREAGRAAAAAAVAELAGEAPALVLMYASVRYPLSELVTGVREIIGEASLAGATSSGHLHNGEITAPERGVAVLALTAGPYRFGVGSVVGLKRDSHSAGRALARAARRAAGAERTPHAAVLILADGLRGDPQELVSGVHRVTGATVPVVGGAAADDRQLNSTSVVHDGTVMSDAAVAVWIGSPWPLTVTTGHGWRPVGLPTLVTDVAGVVVRQLGGRPAATVVRDQLHQAGWGRRPAAGGSGGYHPAHAFGLLQPDGTLVVRTVYLGEDGQLRTLVPLPMYTPVQIVTGEPSGLLSVVSPVVRAALTGREPAAVLAFSCLSRLELLAGNPAAEAAAMQAAAGAAATFGFYTYGEFARTTSLPGYHNATLATIAL